MTERTMDAPRMAKEEGEDGVLEELSKAALLSPSQKSDEQYRTYTLLADAKRGFSTGKALRRVRPTMASGAPCDDMR